MGTLFHINDIVKFAIEKEEESYELYSKLFQESKDTQLKALFQKLASEEQKHKSFYEFLMTVVKSSSVGDAKEPEDFKNYMQELISSSRSTPPVSTVNLSNMEAAIQYAIAREKDSILFYTGLKQYLPEKERASVNEIIKEEAKHVAILSGMRLK